MICIKPGVGRAGVAVAEDDDVLEVGGAQGEGFVGLRHDALEAAEVALVHAGDLAGEGFLVADFLQREKPMLRAVPQHDAHFIAGAQRGQHALGAVAGHLVAVGEFHAMHDQHHGAAGQDFFAVQFHADGKRGFEGRAAVAAGRIGLVAADADESHAEIAHGAFEQALAVGAEVAGRKVVDEDAVVTLHFGEIVREGVEAAQADLQRGRTAARWRGPVLFGFRGDDQDAGFAADGGEAGGAVVLRHRIIRGIHADVVAVETLFREGLREGIQVLARRELHLLLAQELLVAVEPHGRGLVALGLDEDLGFEGLVLL